MKLEFKKENYKYLIYLLFLFAIFITSNFVHIFKFIYSGIADGVYNEFIHMMLSTIFIVVGLILFHKIFKTQYENDETLPIPRVITLYCVVSACILLVSGLIGWNVKVIYDMGLVITVETIMVDIALLLYTLPKIFIITLIIHYSHIFIFKTLQMKNEKIKNTIPFGGIFLLITFGLTELILGIHYLSYIYLIFNIVFGFIYLLTKKSIKKTYILSLLIYLF